MARGVLVTPLMGGACQADDMECGITVMTSLVMISLICGNAAHHLLRLSLPWYRGPDDACCSSLFSH